MDIMKMGGIALIGIIGIFFLLPALTDSFGGAGGSLGGGAAGYGGETGAASELPLEININVPEYLNGSGKESSQILEYDFLSAYAAGHAKQAAGGSFSEIKEAVRSYGGWSGETGEKIGLDIAKEQGISPVEYLRRQGLGTESGKEKSQTIVTPSRRAGGTISSSSTSTTTPKSTITKTYGEASRKAYGTDFIGQAYGGLSQGTQKNKIQTVVRLNEQRSL